MTIKRVTFLQELLAFIGLGGRLHLAWISSAEAQQFAGVVADFTEHIRALGPNPLNNFEQPDRLHHEPKRAEPWEVKQESSART